MRTMQSDYMHWAKFKRAGALRADSSEVPHFRMDRLPIEPRRPRPRWREPPALPAAARGDRRKCYGVTPEQVVAADGTSMANFLAMAALIAPGDEVADRASDL